MNVHASQTSDKKSGAASATSLKQQSSGEETTEVSQDKLLESAPTVQGLRTYQDMANNSPQVKQLQSYQAMADQHNPQLAQLAVHSATKPSSSSQRLNRTGLPNQLKSGVENLSGYSMDDVKVHYNSEKPAQLNAHAFAQGSDIHISSGQEKHLAHEAWHVVQQKQGRVRPTQQLKGEVEINDDKNLETEADQMGEKAIQMMSFYPAIRSLNPSTNIVQLSVAQLEEVKSATEITGGLAWGLVKAVMAKEYSNASLKTVIDPLIKVGDTIIFWKLSSIASVTTLGSIIGPIITVCKAALAIWDMLSDNIKTGLLYVLGIFSANAPILSRYPALQDFVVKSDEGAVRATVQGWVDSASSKLAYLAQPLASLYSWVTGSGEKAEDPDKATEANPAETEKLLNLNLHVITLMVNNLKLGYDKKAEKPSESGKAEESSAEKKDPGLIVEFFVQLHLFGQDIPERSGQVNDQLFFPFSGEFKYMAGSPIVVNSKDRTLLGNTLGPINIFPLEVSKSGVKKAGLNVSKLIIGNGIVVLTDASGLLEGKLITLKTKADLNIASYSIGGTMDLQFDNGAFKSLELTEVNDKGNFKIKKFALNNNYGGVANVQMDKLDLLENTLSATNIEASGTVENRVLKSFDFKMDKLSMDAFGSSVDVKGAHLKYVGADPNKDLREKIAGGAAEVNAKIGQGVDVNLKGLNIDKSAGQYDFSSGLITFKDFTIEVKKASIVGGGISIIEASLSIPEYGIKAVVNAFSWNSSGLDFDSMQVLLPGKTINPIEQVQLSNMSLILKKDKGYSVTVTSDITLSPNGKPMVGATGAELTMTKEEISGTLKQLNISTSMFDVLIKEAQFNKDKIGATEAGVTFKSKEEDSNSSSLLPEFDTGLLEYINLSTSLKAKDAYFNKGKGFSVGSVSPMLKAFSITLFGVQATVNPEERSITIESKFNIPGNVDPFWPFSLSIPFPIFIGVAGHFGLELGGGVELDFKASAKKEKGKNKPYKFEGQPGINGELHLKISAGVELGARLAVALQANLYAQAAVNFNTKADLSGSLLYADDHLEFPDPLQMLYELKNKITAEVGGELRLKAFMFYDKQLTRVQFKNWDLGEWSKSGEISSSKDGKLNDKQDEGKFGKAPGEPMVEKEILEGKAAQELLLQAQTRIIGSGAKRKEILSKLTVDVKNLSSQLLHKHQVLKRDFDNDMNKLMEIILRKDLYFRENINLDGIQKKLDDFDKKHKLDDKRDVIRTTGGQLDEYEAELGKILGVMNDVESSLDIVALEEGTGSSHSKIEEKTGQAKEIQTSLNTLNTNEVTFAEMKSDLDKMGANALTVTVSNSVMTASKFIELSTTKGVLGGENERKRVAVVDKALVGFDEVRNGSKEEQIAALEKLLPEVTSYALVKFSSRTESALLLQYQVESALIRLKKK